MILGIKKNAGRALLLLICFATPMTWVSAQHGGKAEGRQIRFERGKTSATYKGQVSGPVETEYEIKAAKGQELIVRLVSNSSDSTFVKIQGPNSDALQISCLAASSEISKELGLASKSTCFESDQEKLKRNGQTWSVTLPESGAYTLAVYKPNGEPSVATYILTVIVRPRDKETESTVRADAAALDVAMRKFIAALVKRDVEGFLLLFSRQKFFYARNPMNVMRVAVSYSELAKDLRKKGDWYFTYLERGQGGDYDAFVDNIGKGEMWRRVDGFRYVPPGSDISSATFVKWRREGGKWVIDEISYPQA